MEMSYSQDTETYDKYKRMILSLAYAMKKRFPHGGEMDDLIGVGNLAYVNALRKQDGRASFCTYLHIVVKNAMMNHAQRNVKTHAMKKEIQYPDLIHARTHHTKDGRNQFLDRIKSMSNEAREVIKILLYVPEELFGCIPGACPRNQRGALRRYLRLHGWTHAKVWSTFREIKAIASSIMERT